MLNLPSQMKKQLQIVTMKMLFEMAGDDAVSTCFSGQSLLNRATNGVSSNTFSFVGGNGSGNPR